MRIVLIKKIWYTVFSRLHLHTNIRIVELIFFFIYCGLFVLILVVFVLFLLSQCFGQISKRTNNWIYKTKKSILDRSSEPVVPGEHYQKIAVSNPTQVGQRFTWPKTWCDKQQLWKAVITGGTVTRLSIPIRGRGKITWSLVKQETTQKLPRWGQKIRNK